MGIKFKFETNFESFKNDYMDIIRAFYPYIEVDEMGEILCLELNMLSNEVYEEKIYIANNCLKYYKNQFKLEQYSSEIDKKSQIKRKSKVFLYEVLSSLTGVKLPYGSLTGIRPTKLYHEMKIKGIDVDSYFINELKVSENKTKLISKICENQKELYIKNDKEVDVFVNIPICITRCSYCSFLSAEYKYVKNLICPYTNNLLEEIDVTKQIVKDHNLKVRSVYIGGGTPTSLDNIYFEKIVKAANFNVSEYTVEAGRPDTITLDKLKIMEDNGVTRISINPQSFNQKTLDIIGRKHSVEDIYKVYDMARNFKFDINMDLIAMLPNETFEDFKCSIDKAIALYPENITVHTLAIKRGSILHENNYNNSIENSPNKFIDYSINSIMNAAYMPYYMYRQKHVCGNLENIGYALPGKSCIYNVDIMEETHSIIANGAGAISKLLDNSKNLLTRLANPKGLNVYLERKDEILNNKINFFKYI